MKLIICAEGIFAPACLCMYTFSRNNYALYPFLVAFIASLGVAQPLCDGVANGSCTKATPSMSINLLTHCT